MQRWAVGYFSMMDNVLTVEIIAAATWWEAVRKHSKIGEMEFDASDIEDRLDVVQIPE